MQQVSAIAARSKGFAVIKRLSDERLSDAEFMTLAQLTTQMVAAYPHQELADSLEIFQRGYEILAVRHGLRRVKAALVELLIAPGRKFFPHPSELCEALQVIASKERQQFLKENPYVPCGKCEDGIVLLNRDGSPYNWSVGGSRYATDCECKVEWRKRAGAVTAPIVSAAATALR
jgi:hypothetical protein